MHTKITSLKNENIKNVVRLRTKKARIVSRLTIIEGYSEVERAFNAGANFKEIYICSETLERFDISGNLKGLFSGFKKNIYEVSPDVFEKISYGDRNEGVLAVCQPKSLSFDDFSYEHNPLFIILEGIEKPGNLGAIFRSAQGAGIDGIIICDKGKDIYSPNIVRASMATIFTMKFVVVSNEEAYEYLKSNGVLIYSTSLQAKEIYYKQDFKKSAAIVVGNENKGISAFWMEKADIQMKIPMGGEVDSLNVSAAAAILMYEAQRQRDVE